MSRLPLLLYYENVKCTDFKTLPKIIAIIKKYIFKKCPSLLLRNGVGTYLLI